MSEYAALLALLFLALHPLHRFTQSLLSIMQTKIAFNCATNETLTSATSPPATMVNLLDLLHLERVDANNFSAAHNQLNSSRGSLFGGQILAQALLAAQRSLGEPVDGGERWAHSLHAYFLRLGRADSQVLYSVDNLRDGKSFSVRSVSAHQNGSTILTMNASFQKPESGLRHQIDCVDLPSTPRQRDLQRTRDILLQLVADQQRSTPLPFVTLFDLCTTERNPYMIYADGQPRAEFWIKNKVNLPEDQALQCAALAAASDMGIAFTSTAVHKISMAKLQIASLDHALWLHSNVDLNQWHLVQTYSPFSGHGRGLNRASIYDAQGRLVASAAQENLLRVRK